MSSEVAADILARNWQVSPRSLLPHADMNLYYSVVLLLSLSLDVSYFARLETYLFPSFVICDTRVFFWIMFHCF